MGWHWSFSLRSHYLLRSVFSFSVATEPRLFFFLPSFQCVVAVWCLSSLSRSISVSRRSSRVPGWLSFSRVGWYVSLCASFYLFHHLSGIINAAKRREACSRASHIPSAPLLWTNCAVIYSDFSVHIFADTICKATFHSHVALSFHSEYFLLNKSE